MTDVYEFDPDATALCPVCADVVDVNALDDDDPEYVRCPKAEFLPDHQ